MTPPAPRRTRQPTQDEPRPPSTEPIPPGPDEPPGDDEAGGWRPRWPVLVATGLLAFAIVVALYTVPDLISGSSITGNGDATTLFGVSAKPNKPTPTSTVTTVTITKSPSTTTTISTTTQATSTATTTTTTAVNPTTTSTTLLP